MRDDRSPVVDVRRAADRARTRTEWLDSAHSFSYGAHYDPSNTHFGLLMMNNEDRIRPGHGYDPHPHRDMEIVTWVLSGALAHRDSEGNQGVLYPGLAQRVSAGTGIEHSERNDSATHDVHFVQMWVLPDDRPVRPGYEQRDVTDALSTGEPVVVASGMPRHAEDRAIAIAQRHAALHVARLRPGASAALPSARWVHLFVPAGAVALEDAAAQGDDGALCAGDAARVSGCDGQRVTAGPDGAEILIWEMDAALG